MDLKLNLYGSVHNKIKQLWKFYSVNIVWYMYQWRSSAPKSGGGGAKTFFPKSEKQKKKKKKKKKKKVTAA